MFSRLESRVGWSKRRWLFSACLECNDFCLSNPFLVDCRRWRGSFRKTVASWADICPTRISRYRDSGRKTGVPSLGSFNNALRVRIWEIQSLAAVPCTLRRRATARKRAVRVTSVSVRKVSALAFTQVNF